MAYTVIVVAVTALAGARLDSNVVFLHVPKAGGKAVSDMLWQCFSQARPSVRTARCQIGGGGAFDHVCERSQQVLHNVKHAYHSFARGHANCSYVETHHDHSSVEAMARAASDGDVKLDSIVLKRMPMNRSLSAAWMPRGGRFGSLVEHHWQAKDGFKHGDNLTSAMAIVIKKWPIDFWQKYGYETNHLARQLAGALTYCSELQGNALRELQNNRSALLSRAIAALRTYTHVLLYEHIKDIPAYISCAYGCKNVTVPTTRYYSAPRALNVAVPPAWLEYLNAQNDLDIQLYELAADLYRKQRCAIHVGLAAATEDQLTR